MSDVAIFKPGETPQYLRSVHTPDYEGKPGVLVNPDVSALKDIPLKYWKRESNQIREMTNIEKEILDDAEEAERVARIDKLEQVDAVVLAKALVKAGVVTKQALVSNIKEVLNGSR